MLIGQLSDLHVCCSEGLAAKNRFAERAIAAIARLRPDVVILTGDVTECGTREEYELVVRMLSPLDAPVYAIPGNHDDRDVMRSVFPPLDGRTGGPLNVLVESRPLRLIGLDSTIPGRVEGALSGPTLDFLDEALSREPDVPALVFLHHPPIAIGVEGKDGIRLFEGADRLAALVARHRQVERVGAGHFHRNLQARFGGTICQIAPPVRYMTPAERGDPYDHELDDEPPGFLLHRWIEGSGLVTHLCPIPLTDRAAPRRVGADVTRASVKTVLEGG